MPDPFDVLLRPLVPEGVSRATRNPHEQIEWVDRAARAAGLIRRHELAVWFEEDWRVAGEVASLCPECVVYTVPPEAIMLDHLREPRPWRRGRHTPRP